MAIEPGKVFEHLDVGCWECSLGQVDDFVALAGVDLQTDRAARREDTWCVGEKLTDEVETVRATVERQSGFGGKRWIPGKLLRTQVGEVGENEVDGTPQPRQQRTLDDGYAMVRIETSTVPGGNREGVR